MVSDLFYYLTCTKLNLNEETLEDPQVDCVSDKDYYVYKAKLDHM